MWKLSAEKKIEGEKARKKGFVRKVKNEILSAIKNTWMWKKGRPLIVIVTPPEAAI